MQRSKQPSDLAGDFTPSLTKDSLRRLVLHLIADAQQPLVQQGQISSQSAILTKMTRAPEAIIDTLGIDEKNLGFDSLARLELIMKVNKMFALHESGIEDYLLAHPTVGDWVALLERHLSIRQDAATIHFTTSGSTGVPTAASHKIGSLVAEVSALLKILPTAPTPRSRVISLVPSNHIYGFLFTCLLPSMSHKRVVDLFAQNPVSAMRHAKRGDIVVATPFIWKLLVRSEIAFKSGVIGVSSGGPSDPEVWQTKSSNQLAELVEVYGATETGGIGWRTSPRAQFTLMPHLRKQNDRVFPKNSPTALALQDKLRWKDDRTFDVLGRNDKVVQIGGVNVSPTYIAQCLKKADFVNEAVVRLDHTRLKAFIVLSDPNLAHDVAREDLFTNIIKELPAPARPSSITFGPAIPTNPQGKLTDWQPA